MKCWTFLTEGRHVSDFIPQRSADARSPIADFWRVVSSSIPIVRGRLVTVSVSGAVAIAVRHGMQRAYRGAFNVGQSEATDYWVTATPEATVIGGYSASEYLLIQPLGVGFTGTVRLWVF